MVGDPEEVAQLIHARQDGHLLGHDLVEAVPAEEVDDVRLDGLPVARDVEVHVGLLAPEVGGQGDGLRADGQVEGVRQAVGDVRGEDECPIAALGAEHRGGGGDARLADATLARVEQDAGHG